MLGYRLTGAEINPCNYVCRAGTFSFKFRFGAKWSISKSVFPFLYNQEFIPANRASPLMQGPYTANDGTRISALAKTLISHQCAPGSNSAFINCFESKPEEKPLAGLLEQGQQPTTNEPNTCHTGGSRAMARLPPVWHVLGSFVVGCCPCSKSSKPAKPVIRGGSRNFC